MIKHQKQKGLTLIELLVVISIIGILAAVISVSMYSSRKQARDTRRVADIHQITTALQLYFNDNSSYPGPTTPSATGPTATDGNPDWTTYISIWPQAPTPPDNAAGVSDCNTTNNQYTYTQTNSGSNYNLSFCLGQPTANYTAGAHTLTAQN